MVELSPFNLRGRKVKCLSNPIFYSVDLHVVMSPANPHLIQLMDVDGEVFE
ncbi:hypothetical protein KEJ27_01610 [Candidatus Bathyarchaeota archaeon]|nr:hypothetical protein [Candidatus Bathyarchaeota archaeon]MBS7613271.1 hypothetical protein [Candidatus Bathyarchaeota archaeon]MBS7617656.1 hypothetical protein [Candidatus Bathyarchaeota archaeon]